MEEPHHVVEAVSRDGVSGVRQVADSQGGLAESEVALEESHVASRAHDLLQACFSGREHVAEHAPLLLCQGVVSGDELAQLLLGQLLTGGVRVTPEEPHERVGRDREQPDDRTHQRREPVQGWRDDQRDPDRLLQRQALGHELAQHQREVGDEEREDHQSGGGGGCLGQSELLEVWREVRGEGRATVRGGEEARHGDADLNRGEESVGVAGHVGDPGAPGALLRSIAESWLSRSETRASSVAAKTPPTSTNTSTSPKLARVWVSIRSVHSRPSSRANGRYFVVLPWHAWYEGNGYGPPLLVLDPHARPSDHSSATSVKTYRRNTQKRAAVPSPSPTTLAEMLSAQTSVRPST